MNKILVLGATGMLGSYMFKNLCKSNYDVFATSRWSKEDLAQYFSDSEIERILLGVDIEDGYQLEKVIGDLKPDWVVNCIGLIKQQKSANSPLPAIKINALFPHVVADICTRTESRLLHISTDCVFDGVKGNYKESDFSNAVDLYGRTKYLGEVNYGNHITIRTSIIGHELKSRYGLIDWFLSQDVQVNGFSEAIYSGFTVNELTNFIKKFVFGTGELKGLYQLSSNPINKYDLLMLVKRIYKKDINIVKSSDFKVDRSLDSSILKKITHYQAPSWEDMILQMNYEFENNRNGL